LDKSAHTPRVFEALGILFSHAYDFAQPSDLPACVVGPWLKPSLDFRQWTNRATQIVRDVLLTSDTTLKQLEHDFRNAVYVRTQGNLDPGVDWANETHPTETGFSKLAEGCLADEVSGADITSHHALGSYGGRE